MSRIRRGFRRAISSAPPTAASTASTQPGPTPAMSAPEEPSPVTTAAAERSG